MAASSGSRLLRVRKLPPSLPDEDSEMRVFQGGKKKTCTNTDSGRESRGISHPRLDTPTRLLPARAESRGARCWRGGGCLQSPWGGLEQIHQAEAKTWLVAAARFACGCYAKVGVTPLRVAVVGRTSVSSAAWVKSSVGVTGNVAM